GQTVVEDRGPTQPGGRRRRQLRVPSADEPKIEHGERDDENRQAARNVVENTNGWNAKHRREDHISERKSDANSIGDCIGQEIHGRRKRHESGKEDQRKEVQEARGHCFRSNSRSWIRASVWPGAPSSKV